jgi:proteic killer suppression protein
VDVFIADPVLAKTHASMEAMTRKFGPARARRIGLRLTQLDSCDTLADMRLFSSRIHELRGDWAGHVAIDLDGPYRMLVQATNESSPAESLPLDWEAVNAVTIVAILDYH